MRDREFYYLIYNDSGIKFKNVIQFLSSAFKEKNMDKKLKDKNQDSENVIYVNASKEAEENNREIKEQGRRRKNIVTVFIFLLVVAAIGLAVVSLNMEYVGYRVITETETNYENTASYIHFCNNLLKYTPDGVSYINKNGDTVWSAGINMKMPIAVSCGSYAAVADLNGNTVCVFGEDGQISSLTMPYTICDIDIAKQGAFAVVLESDETNYIKLYDKNGQDIYEMQTTIDKSGYPLDIAISNDGKKLFTSYINMTGTSVTNKLAAYNFGDVGQNANADRMVGGYMFDSQVIPKVEFVDNDTVVAFGTKALNIYSMREKPSERASIDFEEEIQSVFYSEKYIGVVMRSDSDDCLYKAKVYDLKGKLKFDVDIDFNYDYIYADKNEFIISGETSCMILRKNGSIKYNGTLSSRIISIVPTGNRLEYVVTYDSRTEMIRLKSEKNNE